MYRSVALSTECDEVAFAIVAQLASKFEMVNLKTFATAAQLAAPTIPPQDLQP